MTGYFISIGNVIIDDIILPDGSSHMGVLGGGAVHAVMGMRVWTDQVGLAAPVGFDFGVESQAELADRFDLSGLLYRPQPTPRAWQLFESDGTRNEVFRTSFSEMLELCLKPAELPEKYEHLAGVHLHCSPQDVPMWVTVLRDRGCNMILWEPWDGFCVPENLAEFRRLAALVDAVSPNLLESRSLIEIQDPCEIVHLLIEKYEAKMVALRMGAEGSLVASVDGQCQRIPAYPVKHLVDVTGAGNAYCGGFITGMVMTGNQQQAGWYGGVSASLALHQFGALYRLDGINEEAQRRLEWYHQG